MFKKVKGISQYVREVSLHDISPFISGCLTLGKYDTILRKHPLIIGCFFIEMTLTLRQLLLYE